MKTTNISIKRFNNSDIADIVQSTTNYSIFRLHSKNRKIRRDKVENIKKSILLIDILNPIIINEKGEIIDGQHRFSARKELKLPIYFIVLKGAGEKEMQVLNQANTKSNWTHEDYLEMYIKENKKSYIVFNNLLTSYKINYSDLLHIIDELEDDEPIGEKEMSIQFDDGKLVINNLEKITDFLEELYIFNDYDFNRHTSFIRAFLRLYMEDFYDKEYIRHRINIADNQIKEAGRQNSIVGYGKLLAKTIYTSRNIFVTFLEETGSYHKLGDKKGRKPKNKNDKEKRIENNVIDTLLEVLNN